MIFDDIRDHAPFREHAATAAGPQPAPARTLAQAVHRDLNSIGRVIAHGLPLLERIVTSPQLDEFIELALQADGLGVEEAAFASAADVLRGAIARKTTQPQASVPPESGGAVPVAAADDIVVVPDGSAPENPSASLSAPPDELAVPPAGPGAVQAAVNGTGEQPQVTT
jgi:hypothetical protein